MLVMRNIKFISAFLVACVALLSCSKVGDFSVRNGNDKDIFENIEFTLVPDGYWEAKPMTSYVLDDMGNILEERVVDGLNSFPGNVYIVHCWKNGVLVKTISHYQFSGQYIADYLREGEPHDFVFTTQHSGTERFIVNAKTREGYYPLLKDKDFLVTELSSTVFSIIWEWDEVWGCNRYMKIQDADYVSFIESCPNNDWTLMQSLLYRR